MKLLTISQHKLHYLNKNTYLNLDHLRFEYKILKLFKSSRSQRSTFLSYTLLAIPATQYAINRRYKISFLTLQH